MKIKKLLKEQLACSYIDNGQTSNDQRRLCWCSTCNVRINIQGILVQLLPDAIMQRKEKFQTTIFFKFSPIFAHFFVRDKLLNDQIFNKKEKEYLFKYFEEIRYIYWKLYIHV